MTREAMFLPFPGGEIIYVRRSGKSNEVKSEGKIITA